MQFANDLDRSYALRYRVYCLERRFLAAANFPTAREHDEFDKHSLHFGSFDEAGRIAGTIRLVLPSALGLPLFRHCRISTEWLSRLNRIGQFCEISRLAVSRTLRQRASGSFAAREIPWDAQVARGETVARHGGYHCAAVACLFEAIYRAAMRGGITHAVMAMEPSLRRLLARFSIAVEEIGPGDDYYGWVIPYILDFRSLDPHRVTEQFKTRGPAATRRVAPCMLN